MQLGIARGALVAAAAMAAAVTVVGTPAHAEDRFDFTTTLFQENRKGGRGLTVVHPQLDFGVDIGEHTTLDIGYATDVVTGATAAVYNTDAVSTATPFDDVRHEGKMSLGFYGSRSRFNINGGVGVERDYASINFGLGGAIDLPGKNTNLAMSWTHNMDEVCDKENALVTTLERRPLTGVDECMKEYGILGVDNVDPITLDDNTVWRPLNIDTVQTTLTQNLSPYAVMQISAFGQVLKGFQANPYRRVRVGDIEPQESLPDVRGRLALTARFNFYIKPARGAVHMSLRGYSDTWGVKSATGELAYSQYAGESLLFKIRARGYQQTSATFFKDAFFYETESTAGAYFTGDRELGSVRNVLVGGKMSFITVGEEGKQVWGFLDRLQLNLKAEALFLDEVPSNDLAANLAGINDQFLSSNQLFDVFIAQLGLLLSY